MCISWSRAKRGDRVLDLCCGSGDLAFLLSEIVGPHGQVSALDFSWEQLSIASTRQDLLWKPCYSNIEWIEGDALNLPFADNYFDAITMGYGLRNIIDKRKAMQEIFRVLKPGCFIFRVLKYGPGLYVLFVMDFIGYILNEISGSKVSILDFNKSTAPLVSLFQELMIDNVVVPVASTFGLSKEYEYLKASIADFLTGRELEKLADEVGYSNCKHYEIAGGLMGNLVATR